MFNFKKIGKKVLSSVLGATLAMGGFLNTQVVKAGKMELDRKKYWDPYNMLSLAGFILGEDKKGEIEKLKEGFEKELNTKLSNEKLRDWSIEERQKRILKIENDLAVVEDGLKSQLENKLDEKGKKEVYNAAEAFITSEKVNCGKEYNSISCNSKTLEIDGIQKAIVRLSVPSGKTFKNSYMEKTISALKVENQDFKNVYLVIRSKEYGKKFFIDYDIMKNLHNATVFTPGASFENDVTISKNSTLIANGAEFSKDVTVESGGNLTANGAKFNRAVNVIKGGHLTANGAKFNRAVNVIKGGHLTANVAEFGEYYGISEKVTVNGNLTANGANFKENITVNGYNLTVDISNATFEYEEVKCTIKAWNSKITLTRCYFRCIEFEEGCANLEITVDNNEVDEFYQEYKDKVLGSNVFESINRKKWEAFKQEEKQEEKDITNNNNGKAVKEFITGKEADFGKLASIGDMTDGGLDYGLKCKIATFVKGDNKKAIVGVSVPSGETFKNSHMKQIIGKLIELGIEGVKTDDFKNVYLAIRGERDEVFYISDINDMIKKYKNLTFTVNNVRFFLEDSAFNINNGWTFTVMNADFYSDKDCRNKMNFEVTVEDSSEFIATEAISENCEKITVDNGSKFTVKVDTKFSDNCQVIVRNGSEFIARKVTFGDKSKVTVTEYSKFIIENAYFASDAKVTVIKNSEFIANGYNVYFSSSCDFVVEENSSLITNKVSFHDKSNLTVNNSSFTSSFISCNNSEFIVESGEIDLDKVLLYDNSKFTMKDNTRCTSGIVTVDASEVFISSNNSEFIANQVSFRNSESKFIVLGNELNIEIQKINFMNKSVICTIDAKNSTIKLTGYNSYSDYSHCENITSNIKIQGTCENLEIIIDEDKVYEFYKNYQNLNVFESINNLKIEYIKYLYEFCDNTESFMEKFKASHNVLNITRKLELSCIACSGDIEKQEIIRKFRRKFEKLIKERAENSKKKIAELQERFRKEITKKNKNKFQKIFQAIIQEELTSLSEKEKTDLQKDLDDALEGIIEEKIKLAKEDAEKEIDKINRKWLKKLKKDAEEYIQNILNDEEKTKYTLSEETIITQGLDYYMNNVFKQKNSKNTGM